MTLPISAASDRLAPGIYCGIPKARYHQDDLTPEPALSASFALDILKLGPARAWIRKYRPAEPKDCQTFGTAAHAALLERERWSEIVELIEAPDYKTKKARAAKASAKANGKPPLLPKDIERLEVMALAIRNAIPGLAEVGIETAAGWLADVFKGGIAEVTAIAGGETWLKCRPDYVRQADGLDILIDYKTAGRADCVKWTARRDLWIHRAAFYLRAWKAAGGNEATYVFVSQENDFPHFVHHAIMKEADLELAASEINDIIEIYRRCREAGKWPSTVGDPIILTLGREEPAP
jgi:hypothetical protein